MTILSSLQRVFQGASLANGSAYPTGRLTNASTQPVELPHAELCRLLRTLYLSNGAYDDLSRSNVVLGRSSSAIISMFSPISTAIDFWESHTWPEPLTPIAENEAIIPAIEALWKASNWTARKLVAANWAALFGESFVKVVGSREKRRVWFETLEPEYVTEFEEDSRGFLISVRVDVPRLETVNKVRTRTTHTETWSTEEQLYRRWKSPGDASGRDLDDMGPPIEEIPYSLLGIDFTPLVRTPFSNPQGRGIGAVQLALEVVVAGDVAATNLHQMLFENAEGAWVATATGTDAGGRPLPPLRVAASEPTYDALGRQTSNGTGMGSDGTLSVGKRSFMRLPAGYDLKSVIPQVDYAAALAILVDHRAHLETLIPALAYSRISEMSGGDLSGRAIRYKLSSTVDQVLKVRATALEKLEQADAMALTLGQVNGVPGFQNIGSYDAGDFVHEFEPVDVIPVSESERAETEMAQSQAFAA